MAKIKEIHATEILDSRGIPTIETTVTLESGETASASVPSGASVGTYEAVELRDHDISHFAGMGVKTAISNIETIIAPKLIGMDAAKQQEIDQTMITLDGTQNKGRLGANALLSVSIAVCRVSAKTAKLPLYLYIRQFIKHDNLTLRIPIPMFSLIDGGKHAGQGAEFEEYLLIPASSKGYSESLQIGFTITKSLEKILAEKGYSMLTADEGGFGPKLASNMDGFSLLKDAIDASVYKFGFDVFFGLDAAANNFYKDGKYNLRERSLPYSASDLIKYYQTLYTDYHLLYLEDGLAEDDWEGWAALCQVLGKDTMIAGDDLTATNPYRLSMATQKKAITAVVIKPGQIGTVIEALAVVSVAREMGLKIIVSERASETNDDFIADFSVAVSSDYAKFGALTRGERVGKYDRLIEIEEQLGKIATAI